MERIKIYDILHHEHLSQICLNLMGDNCLKDLFDQLAEKGIKIKFSAFHQEKEGVLHFSFCIERSYLKTTQALLLQLPLKEEDIHIIPEAGLVAIYGPHFVERPGIIDAMHNALSSHGVQVLAISTTLSTSFFIISAFEVVRAIDILKETFEIPMGKI